MRRLVVVAMLMSLISGCGADTSSQELAEAAREEAKELKSGQYQAVQLDNGDMYFAHLHIKPGSYKLRDVYYLAGGKNLKKLGNEIHAPEDSIQVPREHVVYWENLHPEGNISRAIKENKAQ